MKKIIYIISAVTMLFSINSCADRFEEIDVNPNQTKNPLSYGIFNSANKEYMDEMRGSFSSGRVALPWVQYSAQRAYTDEDRYAYRITSGATIWSVSYRVAQDYKQIIELNTNPATKGAMSAYGPNENQIAAARTMLAYVFLNLADTYGDVPYYSYGNADPDFQALSINTELQPKFATQAKIYADIMKELKESSMMIVPGKVFTSGDVLFGSSAKLKKFANSLRLRVATRVKGVVPGAEAAITESIASGVMTSNADNVGVMYEDNLVNPSPMYRDFRTRSDFAINKTFVQLLKGQRGNFGLDPRLFQYATPVGVTKALILAGTSPVSTNPADFNGMPYGIASSAGPSQASTANFFSKNVYKKDYKEMFMEYSEVEFLVSEANGWSQANYMNGVKASMEKWGVPAASITAFIATLPAATKETVLNQKYVALFMQPYEAWAEYRRTGYPNTLLLPGQTGTYNVPYEGSTTYTFTSLIDGLTDLPARLFYPTSTQSLNRVNYEAASTSIGGDKMSTKLIWDKN
ncbi:SusD/RagB family nutrient-binding outer membrane lipoprotein [Chryseobacterium sp. MP_3.2]|uniref:SusD/RagB family nutrient-binding outer membrane lipoprotein n=1 Tax=Chryseobacterium sp. MP_3.2 TaxID=3071712 RepID=UPI002DF83738|nr:hypothetical protein [Chryseobacterium sp. MP_3.2]